MSRTVTEFADKEFLDVDLLAQHQHHIGHRSQPKQTKKKRQQITSMAFSEISIEKQRNYLIFQYYGRIFFNILMKTFSSAVW